MAKHSLVITAEAVCVFGEGGRCRGKRLVLKPRTSLEATGRHWGACGCHGDRVLSSLASQREERGWGHQVCPSPGGGAGKLTLLSLSLPLSLLVRQNIFPSEQAPLPAVSVSERVLGNVGRWLDSLPTALHPRVQDTVAGSSWNYPQV